MPEIRSDHYSYQVDKKVAETGNYRLYLCLQVETARQCLLQIASAVEHNGGLQRAAYILKELECRADELEKEYAGKKTDPNILLNYGLGFPELIESFACEEQGGRWINILTFRNVEDVNRMVPLINITAKDRLRVDLRTSAWIMGKLLKLLAFTHGEGMSVNLLIGYSILIEPDEHYVVIFDWTAAQTHPEALSDEVQRKEISQAAQAIITVLGLGGDPEKGILLNDEDEVSKRYTDHILRLARGGESNTERAHNKFYELIDSLWKREFYPFTTHQL